MKAKAYDEGCFEWLRLTQEIAATDREAFRKLRQEAWDLVARSHREKSPDELEQWRENAS